MQYLTLLSILFPCIMGAALFVWKPTDRIIRNRYSITGVLVTSALVQATAFCTWPYGGDAVAVTIARMSKHLVFEFRPDNVATIFGCIIGVLWPVTTIYAFNYMEHEGNDNMFFGFFIITFGVVAGIAYSANFFTLYICYEFMTLVTLPLVMHSMDAKARSAGKKYVLYSMTGAALVFIALMYFVRYSDSLSFTYGGILDLARAAGHEPELLLVFVLAFFGFGVKAAIFPFHRWLPAASVAPTPVTALLHAVAVVKSGAFAVMRLIYFGFGIEFLKGTWAQYVVLAAAAVTVIFGSCMSLRMPHLKRRLAYSTVSNLAYILVAFAAMSPLGLLGGLLHMVFHAVIKITLFFCAGSILHNSHLEYVYEMEGMSKKQPITCAVFVVASLALMGIPPLGGFLSKWTIATASAANLSWAGYLGAAALIVSAILTTLYMMSVIVRFYFPLKNAAALSDHCHEADARMTGPLVFLTVLMIVLSLASSGLYSWIGGMV